MPNDIDLASLSATERTILALLAQGHTAKSIAAEIGRTEGAVNERLREARRKTGVGSSRELARLVRARETRDAFIDDAEPRGPVPAPPGAPPPARQQGKVLLMSILLIAVAAAALTPRDTGAGASGAEAALRATLAREPRDAAWADRAEAALRRRYAAIPGVDAPALEVACRATLCEVKGHSAPGVGGARGRRGEAELGSPALRGSVPGLHADVTQSSSGGDGGAFRFGFDALWRRTERG